MCWVSIENLSKKLFTFLIDHLVPSITSLQCYVCNSNEDPNCASDGNLDAFKQQCSQTNDPYCRKIVQTSNDEKK